MGGALGVEEAKKEYFDAILMDVQMPVMDGIEATKLLLSNGHCKLVLPIIGLMASYQSADWQFFQDCGTDNNGEKGACLVVKKLVLVSFTENSMHWIKMEGQARKVFWTSPW